MSVIDEADSVKVDEDGNYYVELASNAKGGSTEN